MQATDMRVLPSPGRARKTPVGVRGLLEWAFQRECASLEFDEIARETGPANVGMEWVMMERAKLGCRVDGGGRSEPHHDADIVASTLAALPDHVGGRRMAIRIADLARAGLEPDWMPDARPRFYPEEERINRHGKRAKVMDAARLGTAGWPAQPRRNRKGVVVYDRVDYCPVFVWPTADAVARARRGYLAWYGALLELRTVLCHYTHLSSFVVTDEMPPLAPWKETP